MPDIFVAKKEETSPRKGQNKKSISTKKTVSKKDLDLPQKGETAKQLLRERTRSLWAAFAPRPPKIRFETQEAKEKALLLTRKHPITNIPWILTVLTMSLAPLLVFTLVDFAFVPFAFRLILTISWYLFIFAFGFEKFLSWFFNVNIITDERIIDVNFPNILYRDVSQTKIDQVQDTSIKVGGFIRSLFNYGDVLIQTAGAVPEIEFLAVPHPGKIVQILNQLLLEEEQEKLEGRAR